jgi:DNA-binding SARP family transcriptional activator
VDGEPVRPRIAKSHELLAYLASRPHPAAHRDELLDALFEGRAGESTRAYLRQAVRWLRHVLPDDSVIAESGELRLSEELELVSESRRFEAALADAAGLRGEARLDATLAALAAYDRGVYLPDVTSEWAEQRRRRLAQQAADARYEAAELAFAAGRLEQARELVDAVLRGEPYREAAHRLTMRLAAALGDEDGVLRAYRRCELALAEVGTEPAPSTRRLLTGLRR